MRMDFVLKPCARKAKHGSMPPLHLQALACVAAAANAAASASEGGNCCSSSVAAGAIAAAATESQLVHQQMQTLNSNVRALQDCPCAKQWTLFVCLFVRVRVTDTCVR